MTSRSRPPELERIQTDAHKIEPGDWFFPMTIKGVDQHALINQALQAGAVGYTYQKGFDPSSAQPQTKVESYEVPDLREHLFRLAEERRSDVRAQVVVVTGSAGKTSVKEIMGSILKAWKPTTSLISPDNQNTKIALATQILRLPESTEIAVFEMGARRQNDFAIPLKYLQPKVVALLNVGTAHVGEFGSLENLQQEKLSVLDSASARALVVCGDSPLIHAKAQRVLQENENLVHPNSPTKVANRSYDNKTPEETAEKVLWTFGTSLPNRVRLVEETSGSVVVQIDQTFKVTFHCPFESSAKGINVAAAVAISMALQIPLDAIKAGLSTFTGVQRRFQIFPWGTATAIDDAYNASPESMQVGLLKIASLKATKPDAKVLLVLGSMLELGSSSEEAHQQIARSIAIDQSTTVVTVGAEAAIIAKTLKLEGWTDRRIHSFSTASEAKNWILSVRDQFDWIYFKGAKSMALQTIFGGA